MKKFIVANWKMNPNTIQEAEGLLGGVLDGAPKLKSTDIIFCPPFVYLDRLSKMMTLNPKPYTLNPKLGAQDIFWENKGSYTGEISASMLKNLGVKYVIVGHSERRRDLNETNEMINKKIKFALGNNLKVIFCVGEEKRDGEGRYLKFIKKEVVDGLEKIPKKELNNLIICYEPVWAISSPRLRSGQAQKGPDTPDDFLQTSIYIRRVLFFKFGVKIARQTPILYGGSVDAKNARGFLEEGRARGLLVGRASWKVSTFEDLLKNIQ